MNSLRNYFTHERPLIKDREGQLDALLKIFDYWRISANDLNSRRVTRLYDRTLDFNVDHFSLVGKLHWVLVLNKHDKKLSNLIIKSEVELND